MGGVWASMRGAGRGRAAMRAAGARRAERGTGYCSEQKPRMPSRISCRSSCRPTASSRKSLAISTFLKSSSSASIIAAIFDARSFVHSVGRVADRCTNIWCIFRRIAAAWPNAAALRRATLDEMRSSRLDDVSDGLLRSDDLLRSDASFQIGISGTSAEAIAALRCSRRRASRRTTRAATSHATRAVPTTAPASGAPHCGMNDARARAEEQIRPQQLKTPW